MQENQTGAVTILLSPCARHSEGVLKKNQSSLASQYKRLEQNLLYMGSSGSIRDLNHLYVAKIHYVQMYVSPLNYGARKIHLGPDSTSRKHISLPSKLKLKSSDQAVAKSSEKSATLNCMESIHNVQ